MIISSYCMAKTDIGDSESVKKASEATVGTTYRMAYNLFSMLTWKS